MKIKIASLFLLLLPSSSSGFGFQNEKKLIQKSHEMQEKPGFSSIPSFFSSPTGKDDHDPMFLSIKKAVASTVFSLTLMFSPALVNEGILSTSAQAADGAAIAGCLFKKCPLALGKCITNPNCLANVVCINTCNGRPDEEECQIECGNTFENEAVAAFNKCAVSDATCVPQKQDDNSYPVPAKESTVSSFPTKFFDGKLYITAGQNKLFDIFDCQVSIYFVHCT